MTILDLLLFSGYDIRLSLGRPRVRFLMEYFFLYFACIFLFSWLGVWGWGGRCCLNIKIELECHFIYICRKIKKLCFYPYSILFHLKIMEIVMMAISVFVSLDRNKLISSFVLFLNKER